MNEYEAFDEQLKQIPLIILFEPTFNILVKNLKMSNFSRGRWVKFLLKISDNREQMLQINGSMIK